MPTCPASGLLPTDRPSHPTRTRGGGQHMGLALAESRERACQAAGPCSAGPTPPEAPGVRTCGAISTWQPVQAFPLSIKVASVGSVPEAAPLFPSFPRVIPDETSPLTLWAPERSCRLASLSRPAPQPHLQTCRELPWAVRHARRQAHDSSDEDGRQ